MLFPKKSKQSKPKHLDALEPSSPVDVGIVLPLHDTGAVDSKTMAWDYDDVDTLLPVEGRVHATEDIKACTKDPINKKV